MPKKIMAEIDRMHTKHPYQVWSIDITFIKMLRGHMYLTAIIDWYSRSVHDKIFKNCLDRGGDYRQYPSDVIFFCAKSCSFYQDCYTTSVDDLSIFRNVIIIPQEGRPLQMQFYRKERFTSKAADWKDDVCVITMEELV